MSDSEVKYDVHAQQAGLVSHYDKRVARERAECLKISSATPGYPVVFSLNQDKDEDLFGMGIYE